MFDNLKEKILGSTPEKKLDKAMIVADKSISRYEVETLSVGDSAYICSMGARICYGLKVDESYMKNKMT